MMEDKKQFIDDLSAVLSKYLWAVNVDKLEYFKPGKTYNEEVIITYANGYEEVVNVSCDSYVAMLRDICKQGLQV